MRNNAKDANLPRRIDGSGDAALPTASTSSPTASASDGDVPRRIDGSNRDKLPGSAAASSAAATRPQVRRTRLNRPGAGARCAGPSFFRIGVDDGLI